MSKLSTVIAATLLIAAGAASAQTTPLTREQVVADLVAARASGELAVLQSEKGVETRAAGAREQLPRQAVLAVKPTEMQVDDKLAASLTADRGENAARELGDFPAPVVRRQPVLAGR
jgi:hypothetical protein